MPRSSRSKSHKQSKHSSKEAARDYSGSDEDVKIKERSSNGKEDVVSVRVSKDSSVSGERRKHGKDLLTSHGNGDVSEEYTTSSKRREEKSHSDRWNGGSSDEKGVVVNVENKELLKSKDSSKVIGESKSKSRRHDSESVSIVASEKDEIKSGSGNRGEKRKSEKESARKENSQYKESKESKDKDRGSDRGRKAHSDKLEVEASSKQVEIHSSKRGKESTDWPIEEELRNPELEKELEKRMRRRGESSNDKDKYQDDIKEKHREEYKEESRQKEDRKNKEAKHRGESERYKHKEREEKYIDEKYHEDAKRKEEKRKEEKHRDNSIRHRDDSEREKRGRDSKYAEPEAKRLRDGSPVYEERAMRYKDDKDRRRGNEKDEVSDYRSRSVKEQSEKRSTAKVASRYADVDMPAGHSRRRSSPHHRVSKQEEGKYNRDYAYEERSRHNRDNLSDKISSRSTEKVNTKEDSYTGERLRQDSRSSPQVDKSPSSTSNERRNMNRSDVRRSLELEEQVNVKDNKNRDFGTESHLDNEFSQVENDNLSVSSPYTRSSHFSEDDRNKSNNRHRRMGDPNMGRTQNNWKNVPNWPSPLTPGGYMNIPFQHVPPPMFHPLLQQFPPPMFGRPPMKLNPTLPYHVPDHGRPLTWRNQVDESVPPPLWDTNNNVFGDESHLYGRMDWDRRAQLNNQLNNRGWEQSGEMWKGGSVDGQSKDGFLGQRGSDEMWAGGQAGQSGESEMNQVDNVELGILNGGQSSSVVEKSETEVGKVNESQRVFEDVKEDDDFVSRVYLSRVDVSKDVTQPDLYEECTSMMDLDHGSSSDEFDCKILFLEEGVEANVNDSGSLFPCTNDSVFQKAMFLYKKQKEEFGLMNGEKIISCLNTNGIESVPPSDQAKDGSEVGGEPVQEDAAEVSAMEVSKEKDNEAPVQKVETEPLNEASATEEVKKSEAAASMEVDHVVVKQEEDVEEKSSQPPLSGGGLLVACKVEEVSNDDPVVGLADVSSSAEVAVMPRESIEFGSVSLSRIHHDHDHSPESTH